MAKLTDDEARRLSAALSASGTRADSSSGGAAAVDALRALFSDSQAMDELGRALTLDLATYLHRPIRCSVTQSTPPLASGWAFEATAAGIVWWLDLDVHLAEAFADAMIGGDGTGSVGRGRRVRTLVEKIAVRFFRAVANATAVTPPETATFASSDVVRTSLLAGGLCAVATDQYGWQFGARVAALPMATKQATLPRESAPPTSTPLVRDAPPRLLETAAVSSGSADSTGAATALESAWPDDPESVIRSAVEALRLHLQDVLRCQIDTTEPAIARLTTAETPAMPATSLGLALTAGGNGALVALLNAEAVAGLASGAAGAALAPAPAAGDIVLTAAEAIVRDALCNVARTLPGIASDAHRILRLSDNPLPARTPHHAVDVGISVGGRSGIVRLLVPSWMLAHAGASQ